MKAFSLFPFNICSVSCFLSIRVVRTGREKSQDRIHTVPDAGAGEGVPLQPVPHTAATDRDRARTLPHGAPDKDLVPEQEDEVEEGQ